MITTFSMDQRLLDYLKVVRSNAPSALHRLLWQDQKLGTTLGTPLADSHTDKWRLPRYSILHEKTADSMSDPPLPPNTPVSLIYDTQTCFKNTMPYRSGGATKKKVEGASYPIDNIIPYNLRSPVARLSPTLSTDAETTTGATDIRDSSKRKPGSAGLDEGGESGHRLEKVRRAGQYAGPSPYGRG